MPETLKMNMIPGTGPGQKYRGDKKMQCYEELKARGLIAQVTNEEEVSKMVNAGKAVFYIGFDPTADSLHVGHFMAISWRSA